MSRLHEIRKSRNLRITELAQRLNKSPQAVWQQENRGISKINTAEQYAAVLECSPFDILELNNHKENDNA